jgi:hypothetical protein
MSFWLPITLLWKGKIGSKPSHRIAFFSYLKSPPQPRNELLVAAITLLWKGKADSPVYRDDWLVTTQPTG